MKKKNSVVFLAKIGVVTAIYIILTLAIFNFSFGPIQFRVSEILLFLVFFDRKYAISLILGCAISNIFSPLGPIDILIGTAATALSVLLMIFLTDRKRILGMLWAPLVNGLAIGAEFTLLTFIPEEQMSSLPFMVVASYIFIGELIAMIIGFIIYNSLKNNRNIQRFLIIGDK